MWKEFKQFALRGNVMDLAVGVIIGAAFGKIVASLVTDVITPVIGLLLGGINFSGLRVKIGGSESAPSYLTYGQFMQAMVDFVIIALVIFLMIRLMNRLQNPVPVTPTDKECPFCKSKISIQATRCPACTSQLG